MKQEEEPWIDHLKQRVNEYEKPLPIYIREEG